MSKKRASARGRTGKPIRTKKEMDMRLQKCIDTAEYVKIELAESSGEHLDYVNGILLDQSSDLVLMSDTYDFHYTGLVIFRKADIDVVNHTDNERFMKKMLIKEGYYAHVQKRTKAFQLKLGSMSQLFTQIQALKHPIIVECKYGKDDIFQIGTIEDVTDKKVRINHFNSQGSIGAKPVVSKFKDITLITIDSPYANTFYKYAKGVD